MRVPPAATLVPGARRFPLTHEQLANLLGLTPVHINRTIGDVGTLRRIADFSDIYLHRTLD